jgi:hypothetical protein
MRKTFKEIGGTSFHDTTIGTTVHTLIKLLGEPTYSGNDGEDKVNYQWEMETNDGDVFTVYDYKEYKVLDEHEIIEFHIGGMSKAVTEQAKTALIDLLVDQVVDLTMMSKIELGDDVIKEYKRLREIIEAKEQS